MVIEKLFQLKEDSWSSTAITKDGGLLIAVDRAGIVYAYNLVDSTIIWSKNIGPMITASPILVDVNLDGVEEILIGVEHTGRFVCLSLRGDIIWEVKCGSSIRATAATFFNENLKTTCVVISGYGNHMFCLDGKTGNILWKTFIGKHIYSRALGVVSSPLVADVDGDGILEIVTGSRNKMVFCLNALNGKIKWNYYIESDPDSSPSLSWINELPYIFIGGGEFVNGLGDLSLHAINGYNGKNIWKTKIQGGLDSCPVIRDINNDGILEVLITSLADHSCYAFNAVDGKIIWKTPFSKTKSCLESHEICFTKEKYITGKAICRSYTTPLTIKNSDNEYNVLVGSNNGQIMLLNYDGAKIEIIETEDMVRGSFVGVYKEGTNIIFFISGKDVCKIEISGNKSNIRSQFNPINNSYNLNEFEKVRLNNFNFFIKLKSKIRFIFFLIVEDFFEYILRLIDINLSLPFTFLTRNKTHKYE